MILVTVGTTIPFDELLEEADRLAAAGAFGEHVVYQCGQSRYRISHGEQFMARPNIDDLIAESSMVITHGGAGTVLELLIAHKPFVAFPNPRADGDHQTRFLARIATLSNISWSQNVKDLGRLFHERQLLGPASIVIDIPRATEIVRKCIAPGNSQDTIP